MRMSLLTNSLTGVGVTDLKAIADSCAIVSCSYKKLTHKEILGIFKECFN